MTFMDVTRDLTPTFRLCTAADVPPATTLPLPRVTAFYYCTAFILMTTYYHLPTRCRLQHLVTVTGINTVAGGACAFMPTFHTTLHLYRCTPRTFTYRTRFTSTRAVAG